MYLVAMNPIGNEFLGLEVDVSLKLGNVHFEGEKTNYEEIKAWNSHSISLSSHSSIFFSVAILQFTAPALRVSSLLSFFVSIN